MVDRWGKFIKFSFFLHQKEIILAAQGCFIFKHLRYVSFLLLRFHDNFRVQREHFSQLNNRECVAVIVFSQNRREFPVERSEFASFGQPCSLVKHQQNKKCINYFPHRSKYFRKMHKQLHTDDDIYFWIMLSIDILFSSDLFLKYICKYFPALIILQALLLIPARESLGKLSKE